MANPFRVAALAEGLRDSVCQKSLVKAWHPWTACLRPMGLRITIDTDALPWQRSSLHHLPMNETVKTWLLRTVSIPLTLALALVVIVFADTLWRWFTGSEPFFASLFILAAGLWALVWMAGKTVFAPRAALLADGIWHLSRAVGIGAAIVFLMWLIYLPTQPYEREKLQFNVIKPAAVDVTGVWKGSWTDPRSRRTETITLTLEQTGNTISGTIQDEKQRAWQIMDGKVSADQINLHYGIARMFQTDATATLLGTCTLNEMRGEYFGHVPARLNGSSKGLWQASRQTRGP